MVSSGKNILLFLVGIFALTGCASRLEVCRIGADRLGAGAGLERREIQAGPFHLTGYLRLLADGDPLVVYIEGDGRAWRSRHDPSYDPTPRHPVALELAAQDPSRNVLYLARPGQFSSGSGPDCSLDYWTSRRFSEDVIAAMDEAVSLVVEEIHAPAVHLIGYSGGAAVAVLIAARRFDVVSLRTVAGNLDADRVSRYHRVSLLAGLNPIDAAEQVSGIAQRHFIGGKDRIVPRSVTYGFVERIGDEAHRSVTELRKADHQGPWAADWQDLLEEPLERF